VRNNDAKPIGFPCRFRSGTSFSKDTVILGSTGSKPTKFQRNSRKCCLGHLGQGVAGEKECLCSVCLVLLSETVAPLLFLLKYSGTTTYATQTVLFNRHGWQFSIMCTVRILHLLTGSNRRWWHRSVEKTSLQQSAKPLGLM